MTTRASGCAAWCAGRVDRVGPTFKVTAGALLEPGVGQPGPSGIDSTIQLGGFFTPSVGLLGSLTLGGGTDAAGRTFQRHGLALELQLLPLRFGPLALGGFGHGGYALAADGARALAAGPAVGGGALLELALTTRLAVVGRGDWTAARFDRSGWTADTTITGGLAIY